jgi:predicted DsbA family dithiol-disulfide isomerase
MAGPFRIIAYSDYVCPWCYIGFRRIEELQREFDVEVEWRPFELHPETPKTGAHLTGRLGSAARTRAYRERILTIADEAEIAMRMPEVVANSHRALEAAEFVRDHSPGSFDAMHAALFRAYFEQSRDIGDIDVLCEIARECGVDDQWLRQALADETYAARIDETTDAARRDEIMSTPTFIFPGGFRLIGGQEYAVFQSVTRRLMDRIASGAIEVAQ